MEKSLKQYISIADYVEFNVLYGSAIPNPEVAVLKEDLVGEGKKGKFMLVSSTGSTNYQIV